MTKRHALLLFFLPLLTGLAKTKDPRDLEFPTRLEFTPHQVDYHTLSNGIEVFFVEDHEVPLTDIHFFIKAGENRIPGEYAGLAEICAYLITEGGSRTVPKRVFEDSLKNFGASFYGYSGTDEASFTLHLLSKHIPELLPMVVEAIRQPALPENQLAVNKGQYLIGYQSRNSEPSSVASRIFKKLIYGKNSPDVRETTPENLAKITLEKIAEFHKANYRPEHMMIGVAGDFEPKVMLDLLERYLGNWENPSENPWEEIPTYLDPAPGGVYYVHWPEAVQSNVRMGYEGIYRDAPDYPASRLFVEIYGGSWGSRLIKQVRVEKGYAYVAYGVLSSGFTEPGTFRILTSTKTETTVDAIQLILEITRDMKTKGVTEDELRFSKTSWLASFPAYYAEPEQVLFDRMRYAKYDFPLDFWDKLPDKIEPLEVTDVNAFASRFIETEKLVILVLGDSTAFHGSLSDIGEVTIIDPEEY
ncbi:hypothetical protein GF359_07870 [candidate division WOR-3 bacterium]|uniref:Insulinase family protein n=1 Tax=candidate division WOR-3 bacterium TaxID=2052148 RepID=A0A9D5KA76_UNCW3|nr:hypothetical protein [candidate division WOR-3 bacterium]MBD3365117.1 hypothetical protein [candidate division WOR-3 bacterium]